MKIKTWWVDTGMWTPSIKVKAKTRHGAKIKAWNKIRSMTYNESKKFLKLLASDDKKIYG